MRPASSAWAPEAGLEQHMEMKHRLEMRLGQQLVMTPRLQMALRILQVSTLELEQFLKQQMLQNPLLEDVEEEDAELEQTDEESEETQESADQQEEESEAETKPESKDAESDEKPETPEESEPSSDDLDWDDYLDDVYSHAYGTYSRDEDEDRYERVAVAVATFQEGLKHQLHIECDDAVLVGVAEYIIDDLDLDGYVRSPIEEIAETLKIASALVERALTVVQSLDPAGIGARDMKECLLLQLNRRGLGDSLAARVVESCLDELRSRKYDKIRRKLGVATDELRNAIGEISRLDPKPRSDTPVVDPGYIIADLIVEEVDGEYVVYLNDQDVPRVRVSRFYRSVLAGSDSSEDREFISKKLKAARWIVQSIENRRRTMIKVMESIVRAQEGFFQKGVPGLKPLTLQQVADDVGMHESTVSRVTRGKYVQTDRGLFELKYFFSSGIRTSDGGSVAAKSVKDAMQDLISREDKQKPLSDQKIAERLKEMGFTISRRAVAKYRDQMRILRAGLRKQI